MSDYKQEYHDGRGIGSHVAIAERALGHRLPDGAEVHHVDGNKAHNANRNLVICQDTTYHRLLHIRAGTVMAGADPNTHRVCGQCRQAKPFAAFSAHVGKKATGRAARCLECSRAAFSRWWASGGAAKHSARRRERKGWKART